MEALTKYFFLAHIPITLLVDLSPLYPTSRFFAASHWLKRFYVSTFNDPLVGRASIPGGWFTSLLMLEGVVQLPICFFVLVQYARKAQNTVLTRLVVLSYSAQVATATWACLFEVTSFPASTLSASQKLCLVSFYVPYLVIPLLMGWHNARVLLWMAKENKNELEYLRNRTKASKKVTEHKRILITGANSGVGFGIVQQLLDQNSYALRAGDLQLTLILTVRDAVKADSVLARLAEERTKYGEAIKFEFVYMDLLSIASVEAAAKEVISSSQEGLNAIICNAGMVEVVKIDIYKAIMQVIFHPIEAITQPNYKVQKLASKTKDGIATTFQANFFGHYYLIKRLGHAEVLKTSSAVIWMSSLEATKGAFEVADVQALGHRNTYESSKRVIDIAWSARQKTSIVPEYLVHPGYCSTNILSGVISSMLNPLWTMTFHFVRFCGLKFHVATAYNGAYAASMVAMNPGEYDKSKKLGSAGTWDGVSYVCDTHFDPITSEEQENVIRVADELYNKWQPSFH